jgi:site-specific recombinase XerC
LVEKRQEHAGVAVSLARSATALEEHNVRHVFTRMLEKAELRQIRIHNLRHSCATHLLPACAPITYVSQQLGHADAPITLRVYAHYFPESLQRDVDRLDQAVPAHPNASQAHPEPMRTDHLIATKSLRMNGEPRRNQTSNPQIPELRTTRRFLRNVRNEFAATD